MLSEDTIREKMVHLSKDTDRLCEKITEVLGKLGGDYELSSDDTLATRHDKEQLALLREMLTEAQYSWRALNWVVNPGSEEI